MNNFKVTLPVVEPDMLPRPDVHFEWTQYPIWLNGKYGTGCIEGHQIGLSPELVDDLVAWSAAADAMFDQDDPANSPVPDNFLEDGFELAKRVRMELPAEWIVTTYNPHTGRPVELTLGD